ncbi:Carbohydrate binding 6 [Orbilia oligospora]|nr:Carbohydrate binding 6 [Orbilia oligospora]
MTRSFLNNAVFVYSLLAFYTDPAHSSFHNRHAHMRRNGALTKRSGVPSYDGWSLSWSDDFTGPANTLPSSSNWLWDLGTSYPGGPSNWGTGEIQTYVKSTSNSYLDGDGNLNIVPIKSSSGQWTSARMESVGTYRCVPGRKLLIEASIKLPNTPTSSQWGIWPAFWTMGAAFRKNGYTGWPYTGELDVMEAVNGQGTGYNTVHCGVYPGGVCNEPNGIGFTSPFAKGEFHTFSLLIDRTAGTWQNEFISWQTDGVEKFRVWGSRVGDEYTWGNLTHLPMFILLDVAIGGALPNAIAGFWTPTADTIGGLDSAMIIDYVAVYNSLAASPRQQGQAHL